MNVNKDSAAAAELPVAWHQRWARERGLSADYYAKDANYFVPEAPFTLINHALDGARLPQQSYTVHDPANRDSPRDDKDRVIKYEAPRRSGTVIYAPLPSSRAAFRDARTKYIAEGHGKTIALAGLGLPVLGITGIQNWHVKGSDALLPDLADLISDGDKVVVVPDGDVHTNADVASGAEGLLTAIAAVGGVPGLVDLSAQPLTKVDDLILYWRAQGKDPAAEFHRLPVLPTLRLQMVPLTDQAAILTRPVPQWIVKNLIPPGELTAIVGPPSCGKTFLTMDLLLAVARGLDYWQGQRIKRHGLVVHITLEGTGLGLRHRAYMQHNGLPAPLPYVALEQPLNLRDDPSQLIGAIQQAQARHALPVVLIAVDTVNRALGGGDENSSVDMGAFLASAGRLVAAFPGCGVLLVHHTGKVDAAGPRGHSSFVGNVGALLTVAGRPDDEVRTATVDKQREAAAGAQFAFKLQRVELGADEDGDMQSSCVVVPAAPGAVAGKGRRPTDRQFHRALYWYWTEAYGNAPVTMTSGKEGHSIKADSSAIKARLEAEGFAVANREVVMEQARDVLANPELAKPKDGASNGNYWTLLPPREDKF